MSDIEEESVKELEQKAKTGIDDLKENEAQMKKQMDELELKKKNLQKMHDEIEKAREKEKDFKIAQISEDQTVLINYLTSYVQSEKWPTQKIDEHVEIMRKLDDNNKIVLMTEVFLKQMGQVILEGKYDRIAVQQYVTTLEQVNSKEKKQKYLNEKSCKQVFTWRNEYDHQADEYLYDAIVNMNLKDHIKPESRSFKLAEALMLQGLKEKSKQNYPIAKEFFKTAKSVIPDDSKEEENIQNFKVLRAQINFNCLQVMSIQRDSHKEIIQLCDESEDFWIPHKQYSLFFGDVSQIDMIQRFFWDQEIARYDIYGKACQQEKLYQDTANAYEKLIEFLKEKSSWYHQRGEEKIQQLESVLKQFYSQNKAVKGGKSQRKRQKASNLNQNNHASGCCHIF